jgi:hypothetical protein
VSRAELTELQYLVQLLQSAHAASEAKCMSRIQMEDLRERDEVHALLSNGTRLSVFSQLNCHQSLAHHITD